VAAAVGVGGAAGRGAIGRTASGALCSWVARALAAVYSILEDTVVLARVAASETVPNVAQREAGRASVGLPRNWDARRR
jgi:hypothetical protein